VSLCACAIHFWACGERALTRGVCCSPSALVCVQIHVQATRQHLVHAANERLVLRPKLVVKQSDAVRGVRWLHPVMCAST